MGRVASAEYSTEETTFQAPELAGLSKSKLRRFGKAMADSLCELTGQLSTQRRKIS